MNFVVIRRFLKFTMVLNSIIALLAIPIFSQQNMGKGRITGKIVDENGDPLEGVLILAESLNSNASLKGNSDKNGNFAVAGMGTGLWQITASKTGYESFSEERKISQLRRNTPVRFTLSRITEIADLATDEEYAKKIGEGRQFVEEEKYDEALAVYNELLNEYPHIYQVHLNMGACYFKKDDLENSEAEFKKVLDRITEEFGDYKEEPQGSHRALSGLGEVYLKKGDLETSQSYFAQSLEISPENAVAAYNVGEIFFSNQKIDEAIKYFELALQIKEDWSKPCLKLGYVYLNKADFEKSLEYFNKFLDIDPDNPEVPQVKNMIVAIEKMKKN